MYIRSISPIIATILIIVITVAIAGLFYAFTSGIFGSLSSSSNNLVNQQSQIISFTINNVYCSNNILYFNIYNKGNIPININNSIIIFTDNYGNTISVNGSNIICNNGNIIPIGSNSLCYIMNNSCYYNVTNYIKSMNFVYNGINYNYDILGNNKFNLLYAPNNSSSNSTSSSSTNTTSISSGYIPITIYNTQSIPTPAPFQQDIAICNGTINIGPNFAYINNPTLFNQINSSYYYGQNVYFTTTYNSTPDIYSWYEGQLINGSTYCNVWWIRLPNGIPANSNVTIYMYIGNSSSNYYRQYYPYVGSLSSLMDNGQYVFIAYGYFWFTFDGWTGYVYNGSWSPEISPLPDGIIMLNDSPWEGTYVLPPNNGNIPRIPLIVEEGWWFSGSPYSEEGAHVIALFGNTSQQVLAANIGSTDGGSTPVPNLSTFAQFQYKYYLSLFFQGTLMLKSAVTDQYLNYTNFSGAYLYSYLIVNSTYVEAGYYFYNPNSYIVWIPITLLDTYSVNNNGRTYFTLNYNPFQYGTLEISAGDGSAPSYQGVQWVVARAYPPNGVMPSIYIG